MLQLKVQKQGRIISYQLSPKTFKSPKPTLPVPDIWPLAPNNHKIMLPHQTLPQSRQKSYFFQLCEPLLITKSRISHHHHHLILGVARP